MSEEYQIEQVVKRERFYRDTNQWEKWRNCYHPESSKTDIDISWFKGHIDEFVQRSQSIKAAGVAPTHNVTPVDTTVHGSRALSISAVQISLRFEYAAGEYDLVTDLRLVSRLELVDEIGWKILTLEGIYLHDRIIPVSPLGVHATEIPVNDIKDPRSSYKCLIWNIERKGMTARRDLPGIDRPDEVESMMTRHDHWVESGV